MTMAGAVRMSAVIGARRKKREPSNKLPTGLVNMRRRAYDSVLSSVGTGEHDILEEDELKFLQAVECGDLPTVRTMLEEDRDSTSRFLRASDIKDRTAIEMATENEHLDIVEYLVKNCSRTLDMHGVNESLMLAISKGYLRITQALLNHPMYLKSKDKFRLGSLTNYFQPKNNSKFDHDLTPVMLAAHVNEIDIIRLLLRRGDFVKKPHHTLCECTTCNNKRRFDPLKHSLAGIHAYRALASPAYISLTSPDPILTAFLLSKDLMELSAIEKEFKNEYREMAKQCKNYASELLHMCQNSDEVRTILNQEATSLDPHKGSPDEGAEDVFTSAPSESAEEKNRNCTLARLKLAIRYRQKQFVAHPHIQHQLATMWYQNFPGWRQSGFFFKLLAVLFLPASLPFMALIYWTAPNSKAGQMVCTPLVKFIVHTASYLIFLVLLFLQSALMNHSIENSVQTAKFLNAIKNHSECDDVFRNVTFDKLFYLRYSGLTPLEYIIVIYIIGMWWQEIKQIYEEGYKRYLASTWNWLDITMLNLYVSCFILKIIGYNKADLAINYFINEEDSCRLVLDGDKVATIHQYYIWGDRHNWNMADPTLIAEALFAMANVLSFSRMSYVLPVSEFLGPLQISLGRMLGDIIRFCVVFMVVFLAFFCALYNLYWDYEAKDIDLNCPTKQGFGFSTFGDTFLTLFWALFGLASPADTFIPNNTYYGPDDRGHLITQTIGGILFMVYHVVMALVMLNMLIAMMSNSFQEIESDEDVEWKFARSVLWMSYLEKGATLPIPFNLVPSPKSFLYIYRWFQRRFNKWQRRREIAGPPRSRSGDINMGDRRNGVFNIMNHSQLRRMDSTHEVTNDTASTSNLSRSRSRGVRSSKSAEGIMKGIVKRYLFKLQRDKENDEVNEGELDEIKNDISSLRFELLEEFKNTHASSSLATISTQGGNAGSSTSIVCEEKQNKNDNKTDEIIENSIKVGNNIRTLATIDDDSDSTTKSDDVVINSDDVNLTLSKTDDVNRVKTRNDDVNHVISKTDDVDDVSSKNDDVNHVTSHTDGGNHSKRPDDVFLREVDAKVRRMENKMDGLSEQLTLFKTEILEAMQHQKCSRNNEVEYI